MNKKILTGIVAIVLIGALGIVIVNSNRSSSTGTPLTDTEPKKEDGINQQKSLKDLLSANQPQECTFKDSSGNSGNVFVSGGKVRGDFTAESDGKIIKSHSIVDGQTAYFWIDGQTNGYKMPLNTTEKQATQSSQDQQVDLDKKVDYSCKNWSTDVTVFNLPREIKFSDLGSLVSPNTNTKSGSQNTVSPQCSACESLTGQAKDQCKTALKCS